MNREELENVISAAIEKAQNAGFTVIIDGYTISFPEVILETDDEFFNKDDE